MKLKQITSTVLDHGLDVYGAFHPDAEDMSQAASLVLLGPSANFWDVFKASDICQDGNPDPIDRWSTHVVTSIAKGLGAKPIFPFGGPPYAPFLDWAKASGRAWSSPMGMLVHDQTGLMVSYRGVLAFDERLILPEQVFEKPCDTCDAKPCLNACPVDALKPNGYDVPKCHSFMGSDAGADCLTGGCLVRRSCPASAGANRMVEQSAFHMRHFLRANA